jgi:hypothetical protein
MSARSFLWVVCLGLMVAAIFVTETTAQESKESTVTGRPRPNFDAVGLPPGGFTVFPSLTLGSEFSSNVFATDGNEDADAIFTISPEVNLLSDWGRHALGLQGSATVYKYIDNTSEDVEDYLFAGNGRFDILRDTYLTANAGIRRAHEDRGSPNDANGEEPTEYTTIGGELGLFHRFNRLSGELGGLARHLDFDDVDATGGSINNDDRDRMEYDSFLRLGYDFRSDASAFIQGGFNMEQYDNVPDDGGFDRDSYGYDVVGGISFDITNLVFGEFFGGILAEEFDDPAFDSTLGYSLGADIAWNVTPLTTINFAATRAVEETTVAGASSALTTETSLSADHELLRNLILNAGLSYRLEEFDETSRDDNTIEADLGATYLMNRFVHLMLGYNYTQRLSDAPGLDYTEHEALLRVRIQY